MSEFGESVYMYMRKDMIFMSDSPITSRHPNPSPRRFGGSEGAMFCCLSALRSQMSFDQHLDLYMYAKLYHHRRPTIWKSQVRPKRRRG